MKLNGITVNVLTPVHGISPYIANHRHRSGHGVELDLEYAGDLAASGFCRPVPTHLYTLDATS